jgi:hypothetical protein
MHEQIMGQILGDKYTLCCWTWTTGKIKRSQPMPRIIELAVKVFNDTAQYSSLVNPGCHIPKEAEKINNISDNIW